MNYRAYLLDEDLRIGASESFAATCDDEALKIASVLHDACSDVFPVGEVWRQDTMIAKLPSRALQPADGFDAGGFRLDVHRRIIERRQWDILALEDQLQRSSACVRESRRLMEATDDLRLWSGPVAERERPRQGWGGDGAAAAGTEAAAPSMAATALKTEMTKSVRSVHGEHSSGLHDVWLVVGTGGALFALTLGFYAALGWVVTFMWGHIAVWLGWA